MSADIHGGPLSELLADMIPRAAAKAHRQFPNVPAEDFEQELWCRALTKAQLLKRYQHEGSDGLIWLQLQNAATKLGMDDDRYRRAQKALSAGYKVFDEHFYSGKLLAKLIPVLIAADGDPAEAVAQATRGTDYAGIHISTNDPEAAGNYQVMLIDVAAALGRINQHDHRTLWSYYGIRNDDTEEGRTEREKLANSMGLTYEALRKRVSRALRALQKELGGQDPWLKRHKEAA